MKSVIGIIVLLVASIASADVGVNNIEFSNYRDFSLKVNEPGSYTYQEECVQNDLYFDKTSKKYSKEIRYSTEKGSEIIVQNENTLRRITSSKSDQDTTHFSDATTTFTSENTFVHQVKSVTSFKEGDSITQEFLSEGKFENGKVVITRRVVDGQEKPTLNDRKTSSVWIDEKGLWGHTISIYENSQFEAQLADPAFTRVNAKSDYFCEFKYIKQ